MGVTCQVFVEMGFQGRLRKSAEQVGAEILLFTQLLEEFGTAVLGLPGYCMPVPLGSAGPVKRGRIKFLLKVMGVWMTLWLEERQPDVFVLHDR